jgi:hypothetical protein
LTCTLSRACPGHPCLNLTNDLHGGRRFGQVASRPQLVRTGVSVEKLILARLAENSSRQDALQAIFSGWVDIFYHRIRGRFRRKRVFQQPRVLVRRGVGAKGYWCEGVLVRRDTRPTARDETEFPSLTSLRLLKIYEASRG